MDNEQGWKRLAAAVRQRREARGWTQPDVATRGGLSIDRIQAIEGARTDRYSSRTLAKLERGLDWKTGSCREILAGGNPIPITSADGTRRTDTEDTASDIDPDEARIMALESFSPEEKETLIALLRARRTEAAKTQRETS